MEAHLLMGSPSPVSEDLMLVDALFALQAEGRRIGLASLNVSGKSVDATKNRRISCSRKAHPGPAALRVPASLFKASLCEKPTLEPKETA